MEDKETKKDGKIIDFIYNGDNIPDDEELRREGEELLHFRNWLKENLEIKEASSLGEEDILNKVFEEKRGWFQELLKVFVPVFAVSFAIFLVWIFNLGFFESRKNLEKVSSVRLSEISNIKRVQKYAKNVGKIKSSQKVSSPQRKKKESLKTVSSKSLADQTQEKIVALEENVKKVAKKGIAGKKVITEKSAPIKISPKKMLKKKLKEIKVYPVLKPNAAKSGKFKKAVDMMAIKLKNQNSKNGKLTGEAKLPESGSGGKVLSAPVKSAEHLKKVKKVSFGAKEGCKNALLKLEKVKNPDKNLYINAIKCLVKVGNREKALKIYEKFVKKFPEYKNRKKEFGL